MTTHELNPLLSSDQCAVIFIAMHAVDLDPVFLSLSGSSGSRAHISQQTLLLGLFSMKRPSLDAITQHTRVSRIRLEPELRCYSVAHAFPTHPHGLTHLPAGGHADGVPILRRQL